MEGVYLLWPIDQETQWMQVSGSENGSAHMHMTWSFVRGGRMRWGVWLPRKPKSGASPKCVLCLFLAFLSLSVGLKKIRNPERMVRIAVGYTGHTPPKSDDTDANSKRQKHSSHRLCARVRAHICLWHRVTLGASIKAFWQNDVMQELSSPSHLLCNRSHLHIHTLTHTH